MVEFFEILCGFGSVCFLMSFWLRKKSATNLKYQRLWRQVVAGTVLLGGVGEWGGAPGRMPESIQFRVQHAAPKGAADSKASPHEDRGPNSFLLVAAPLRY